MPSIQDVAEKAGVSVATVSRSFRTPELLTEETKRRVVEAARQLNYTPRRTRAAGTAGEGGAADSAEGGAGREAPDAIGFQFLADRPTDTLQSNTFYAPMLMGAQEAAAEAGLHLLVHTTDRHRLARALPRMVEEQAIVGMVLVGSAGADPATLARFADLVPHLILLDDPDATGRFESVTSDGFGGARAATRYLLELGHRRIAFFLAEEEVRPFRERLHGYAGALLDAGIMPDPALVIGGRFEDSDEARRDRIVQTLTGMPPGQRPTALLTANDEYAFVVLRVLRQIGLRVPDDISLIGFDDISFSTHTDPPLTTVHVDGEAMGRLAVQRLVARLHPYWKEEAAPVQNRLPVSLVVRQSCRAI